MAKKTLSLEEISDRIQINDLLIRYALAIDTKDWDLLDTCFAEGAVCDYRASGGISGPYTEVREWLARALAPFSMTQHLIGNTSVAIEGHIAKCRTMVYNPMGLPNEKGGLNIFTVGAYYHDRLVCGEAGWQILERREELAFMNGALPANFEIPA